MAQCLAELIDMPQRCAQPGQPHLEGYCYDHFKMIFLETELAVKRHLMEKLTVCEHRIKRFADQLESAPESGRPSILHRCICGFASTSYFDTDVHIRDFDNSSSHRHEDREKVIPKPTKAPDRNPHAMISLEGLSMEEIG